MRFLIAIFFCAAFAVPCSAAVISECESNAVLLAADEAGALLAVMDEQETKELKDGVFEAVPLAVLNHLSTCIEFKQKMESARRVTKLSRGTEQKNK